MKGTMMNNTVSNSQFSFLAIIKFAVCIMLFGLACRLFLSSDQFLQFSPFLVATDQKTSPPSVSNQLRANLEHRSSRTVKCDLFRGDWIADAKGPFYTDQTCSSIQTHQNCMKNGRPDMDYIHWRWRPRDCELPRFDPGKFLNLTRNRSMAFIGDSIMRNHVQSLLCILSQEEKVDEVYHDEQYKSRRWYFPANNFTLSVVWSPYLTKAVIFEDNDGVSTDIVRLHLDKPDDIWKDQFKNFDYVILAGGKWFLKPAIYYEKDEIVGCHSCNEKNITELRFDYVYRKALNSTLEYILRSKHEKVNVLFRTTTPDHFENGEWNTGGYCNRTLPFKEGEAEMNGMDELMHQIEVKEFERALTTLGSNEKGLTLKLFDTTYLSLLRPDGHPGIYRHMQPSLAVQNDCLHWCLPGPIDSWNDLMMEMIFPFLGR
ncbi:unnamed protein product [Cuscuta epithymum]|uniref:Trichome birefringence-like N-terminal domain-containing protein n=1 Tax=Cuscuta epithymum TaxID=186058 RepID=A0AAV0D501_9ASTE|nr:unnamed protein product [Cuscuta epithymum]